MTKPDAIFSILSVWILLLPSCAQEPAPQPVVTDTVSDSGSGEEPTDTDTGQCTNVIVATVRDFTDAHPDFERADAGWGPARGLIRDTLTEDRKPVYNRLRGDCQLQENGTCIPTVNWGNTPMWGVETADGWTAEETFSTWYRDDRDFAQPFDWYAGGELNRTFLREIHLMPSEENPGSFVFESNAFFPLQVNEGFGESPEGAGHNFLFTTEIHLRFEYIAGHIFTFRGDDDLWIFVNDRLALDLGGLHEPFEGVIDFDAQALKLDIVSGGIYAMDIFHAERHTAQSNFRIETNIRCFVPVVVE